MYRIEKYKWENRNRLYFSSDWHIFHNPSWEVPIWEARGYLNAQDSAEKILQKVNEQVGENDILYYLGDGFLNTTDDLVLAWLKGIKCKNIKFLWGNHESNMYRLYKAEVLKQYGKEGIEVYPLKMNNVEFVGTHQEISVGKKRIVMNHFPLRIFGCENHGSWNLSGHSHLQDKGRRPEAAYQKALDVGWDYKNAVWSYDEIEDVMSTKSIVILDHNATAQTPPDSGTNNHE